jgi:hypothetical protein
MKKLIIGSVVLSSILLGQPGGGGRRYISFPSPYYNLNTQTNEDVTKIGDFAIRLYIFLKKFRNKYYVPSPYSIYKVSKKFFTIKKYEIVENLNTNYKNLNLPYAKPLPRRGTPLYSVRGVPIKAGYQCTEYIKRFVQKVYHLYPRYTGNGVATARVVGTFSLNKKGYFNGKPLILVPVKLLKEYKRRNRGYIFHYPSSFNYFFENYPPVAGTILSFSKSSASPKYGHTAMVKYFKKYSPTHYRVYVAEQNYVDHRHNMIYLNRVIDFKKEKNHWIIQYRLRDRNRIRAGGKGTYIVTWAVPMVQTKVMDRQHFALLIRLFFANKLKTPFKKIQYIGSRLRAYRKKIGRKKFNEKIRAFIKKYPSLKPLLENWLINDRWNDTMAWLYVNNIWHYYYPNRIVTKRLFNITLQRISKNLH